MSPRKLRLLSECLRHGHISYEDRRAWANDLDAHAKQLERRDDDAYPILNNSEQPLVRKH